MLLWLGVITLFTYIIIGLEMVIGSRRISFLNDCTDVVSRGMPSVSIVVAARNEERNIRNALQSLLQLTYPVLQIIVVNDRSEDSTGLILSELSATSQNLETFQVRELPNGWLGKNHALWIGSKHASGDLLLFTDADVIMTPDTLIRAVNYLLERNIDHLAATPELNMPGKFLNMFGATFGFVFALFTRPWKARDPKSSCHIGIGAFNLVRKACYQTVGGHKTIALRPDDDLKLGKIIKKSGFRQEMVYGNKLISVEWYATVREVVLGLEKNIFAGTDYRLWLALAGVIFHTVASLWPYLAIFTTDGATQWLYAVTIMVITMIAADSARLNGLKPWYALGFPLTIGLFVFIIIRNVSRNLIQGGIYWRGTFYSLKELRENKV